MKLTFRNIQPPLSNGDFIRGLPIVEFAYRDLHPIIWLLDRYGPIKCKVCGKRLCREKVFFYGEEH